MNTVVAAPTLRQRAAAATSDPKLQAALSKATDYLAGVKATGVASVTNYEALRDAASAIKAQVIADLPAVLERMADNVEARGGHVHWASTADEATATIAGIVKAAGARVVVKSKSMATEEIHLNPVLEDAGIEVVETDLGEWIIQLAKQTPSHIIAPAIHLTRGDVADLFNRIFQGDLSDVPAELCAFARQQLRDKFLAADVGISGANFGVAETGTIVLVTNEGNGRMVTSLPRTHIAVMGMERVIATWDQLDVLLALLTRAATGQRISTYVTAVTGPRRAGEVDGPEDLHLVVIDNGRSAMLGTEFQEMLSCIRCGACLNVCPVYRQIGGHAYGSVYSGPMGAVLTPLLGSHDQRSPRGGAGTGGHDLPGATSLCGACWQACPVKIPLQDLLLSLRRGNAIHAPASERVAWKAWAAAWRRPATYRASVRTASTASRVVPGWAAPGRWTDTRELPRADRDQGFRSWFEGGGR